jgi:hypothetical protein
MENQFEELEQSLEILRIVAETYPPSSEEYLVVELAAKALLFIYTEGQYKSFQAYVDTFHDALTQEQQQFLDAIQ